MRPLPGSPSIARFAYPRAESAGSEDIFGVPEFQCTRSCSRRTLWVRQARMNGNSAVEIPESADSGILNPPNGTPGTHNAKSLIGLKGGGGLDGTPLVPPLPPPTTPSLSTLVPPYYKRGHIVQRS